jgi:uncharacterized protein involved in exopolysaccharide biosynthesis
MEELNLNNHNGDAGRSPSLRDLLAIVFRHRRLLALSFLGIFSGSVAIALLQPNQYEAAMKILVKRERADPIVTPQANTLPVTNLAVSEEELNSEVELLKGGEMLEKIVRTFELQAPKRRFGVGVLSAEAEPISAPRVRANIPDDKVSPSYMPQPMQVLADKLAVQTAHFQNGASEIASAQVADVMHHSPQSEYHAPAVPAASGAQSWSSVPATVKIRPTPPTADEAVRIANAVRTLDKKLKVEVLKKTDLIEVTYESENPQVAAQVLWKLADLYLEKHVAVHRPPGAFDFFQKETGRYRQSLTDAEAQLLDFTQDSGVISAALEKEVALQKLAEFEATLKQTQAAIADTQERIGVLQQVAASTPSRVVSQVRESDDGMLLAQLRSNLMMLQEKRAELLGKFQPGYRAVQEVDAQINEARAALAEAEKSKLHDETTDRDATYEGVRSELARSRADLAGLQARAQAIASTVWSYQGAARALAQKEIVQSNLMRTMQEAQENYLLYLHKQEEARISDALDRGRILNVAVVEPPTPPSLPSNHRLKLILTGLILATLVSLGLVFVWERLDSTFRTPEEVSSILDIPVLASMPSNGKHLAAI